MQEGEVIMIINYRSHCNADTCDPTTPDSGHHLRMRQRQALRHPIRLPHVWCLPLVATHFRRYKKLVEGKFGCFPVYPSSTPISGNETYCRCPLQRHPYWLDAR